MIKVYNMDKDEILLFQAKTPLQAMEKLIYTLNWKHQDNNAKVELFGGGRTLGVVHNGVTYACKNYV